MRIEVERVDRLRFDDGSPVRAASAVAPLGPGYLVVQDDATHGAWVRGASVTAVRLLPAVAGFETFEEASGTKHLKPDLEAAAPVTLGGTDAVLMLGSGSSPARTRWSLARATDGRPVVSVADLAPLYARVAEALSVPPDHLNLEGACVVGDSLRWFHRGLPTAGSPSASVDLDLRAAVAAALGDAEAGAVAVGGVRTYELGSVGGTGLAVTDAVALADGTLVLSAAAEDSPNVRDDGPVVGSALVRLEERRVADVAPLPTLDGRVTKVEGLTALTSDDDGSRLLAVVDADDPEEPSLALHLLVSW